MEDKLGFFLNKFQLNLKHRLKRQKCCMIPLCEIAKVVKFMETQSRNETVVASEWGQGENKSCLMAIEFQFCNLKTSWRLVAQHCKYS